jgi:YD repeat-containing protein
VNEYSYDAYGNLQTVKTTKNGQTTVQRYSYNSSWSDELTSFDGRAIMYDTLGKPTEYYNGMSFTWAAGKLATVQNGENSVSYRYDYQGLREEKTVNGVTTKYLYEGHDLIAELSEDPIYFTYDGSFNLVGFEWNGTAYYYQYDIFGDVVGIVNVPMDEIIERLTRVRKYAAEKGISIIGFWSRPAENLGLIPEEEDIGFCGGERGNSLCVAPSGQVFPCGCV